MMRVNMLIFFVPAFLFGSISSDLHIGLRALQQIRTVVPERLSDQEFSIIIDRKAFVPFLDRLAAHSRKEPTIPSLKMLARSSYYYLHWTTSGEPIRIFDLYQEFEYGPYWLYPSAMHLLYDMDYGRLPPHYQKSS